MISSLILVFLGLAGFLYIQNVDAFYVSDGQMAISDVEAAFELLDQSLVNGRNSYYETMKGQTIQFVDSDNEKTIFVPIDAHLSYEQSIGIPMTVDEDGFYHIRLRYTMDESVLNNATIAVKINGSLPFDEAKTVDLPLFWKDMTKDFGLDSYGDEALPLQEKVEGPYEVGLYNNTYISVEPLLFYLKKGSNTIEIENVSSSPFRLDGLNVAQPVKTPFYSEYHKTSDLSGSEHSIVIDATEYTQKNSSYVRLFSHQTPTVEPFDPVNRKLNVIVGESWYDPGKEITYGFSVKESGNYKLSLHVLPMKNDFNVFRTIRIDGKIPFEELKSYAFEDTTAGRYNHETLKDDLGEPYLFYLEAGEHTITLRADFEPLFDEVRMIQLIIDHINQFSLDIRKITGKEVDKNRTWKLTEYLPETEAYLRAYDTLIKHVIDEGTSYAPNGASSSTLSFLQNALVKLDKCLEKPDELPLYFEDLYSGSGSVNQMLGDSIEALTEQPMSLDSLVFHTGDLQGRANASFISKQIAGLQKFTSSFTTDKYIVTNDEKKLNVWVNRQITHVDTLQKLVDSEFTPKTGIKVKISVMPDANKLVLASSANEAPDVAMGLLSYMPFDLAIRGAGYDLTEFDDFWSVADRFTPGAFVPYVLEDGVYALPETLEFFTTVYRKDIFSSLNLEVPDTWQDVRELLPELQRYGMNFYHPIAGGGSIKWFYQTSPFIYQNGGELYKKDGFSANIDSPEAVAGLQDLTKLFSMYSLPEQEPLFYNSFRYGTLPIGIADFVTYMQIKNAAPELAGQWELAPYPAMEDADGNLNRWYIANGRGSVIMKDTQKADEAWEFLKWWTDESVQTTYSYTLQSIYGPEYLWLSANLEAVKNSPIDMQDKTVILDQIKWLRDVPRTPGQYMLERGLSDIWNKAVYDGIPTRIAIDQQVITINREIKRKMIEFGYLDAQGNVLRPYNIRDIDWIVEQIDKKSKGGKE